MLPEMVSVPPTARIAPPVVPSAVLLRNVLSTTVRVEACSSIAPPLVRKPSSNVSRRTSSELPPVTTKIARALAPLRTTLWPDPSTTRPAASVGRSVAAGVMVPLTEKVMVSAPLPAMQSPPVVSAFAFALATASGSVQTPSVATATAVLSTVIVAACTGARFVEKAARVAPKIATTTSDRLIAPRRGRILGPSALGQNPAEYCEGIERCRRVVRRHTVAMHARTDGANVTIDTLTGSTRGE